MAEYLTLIGAEDVSRAGGTMREAAQTMTQAASSISYSLEMHQRFLDDWLIRFTEAIQIASPAGETIGSAQDEATEASPMTAQPAVGEASPLIGERVRKLIVDMLGFQTENVPDTASWEDLNCDSLDKVELVMAVESEFGIEVPDRDAERLLTVGDTIKYVEKAKGGHSG